MPGPGPLCLSPARGKFNKVPFQAIPAVDSGHIVPFFLQVIADALHDRRFPDIAEATDQGRPPSLPTRTGPFPSRHRVRPDRPPD